jgi:hypothetical protein
VHHFCTYSRSTWLAILIDPLAWFYEEHTTPFAHVPRGEVWVVWIKPWIYAPHGKIVNQDKLDGLLFCGMHSTQVFLKIIYALLCSSSLGYLTASMVCDTA